MREGSFGKALVPWVWLGTAWCLGAAPPLSAQECHVDLERENRVRFLSDAPREDFQGTTDRIDGFLFLAGGGLAGPLGDGQGGPLARLDTGIGLRNRHMRDNYLDTNQFPFAVFSGGISSLTRADSGEFHVTTRGILGIHGVDREREVECQAETLGQGLRVRCAFQVRLSDHDIPIPKLMFMTINEVMEVELDFFLSPADGG